LRCPWPSTRPAARRR